MRDDMVITNIQTTTNKAYTLRPLVLREPIYLDRPCMITGLPTIPATHFLQTAKNDKANRDAAFLTFAVDEPVPDGPWKLVDNSVPGLVTVENPTLGPYGIRWTVDSRREKT